MLHKTVSYRRALVNYWDKCTSTFHAKIHTHYLRFIIYIRIGILRQVQQVRQLTLFRGCYYRLHTFGGGLI